MLLKAVLLWVIVLITAVPYATYYLFYRAQPSEYALLIVFILFWIFGYWGIVGPILTIVTVRRVSRTLETAHAQGRLSEVLLNKETQDVTIDLLASEIQMPRFVAAKIYQVAVKKLSDRKGSRNDRCRNA